MSRQAAHDAAREVLRVPFALTRTIRAPESGVRRPRAGESDGRRTWTFDLAINSKNYAPEVPCAPLEGKFKVRASSAEIAAQGLGPAVCAWLIDSGSGFHYEIVHDRVLAYGWRRYLGGKRPLRAALGLAAVLG